MKGRADPAPSPSKTRGNRHGFHGSRGFSLVSRPSVILWRGLKADQGAPSPRLPGAGAAGGGSRTHRHRVRSAALGWWGPRGGPPAATLPRHLPGSILGGGCPGRAPEPWSRAASPHPARWVPFTAVGFRHACPGFVRRFGWRKVPLSWVARGGAVLGVGTVWLLKESGWRGHRGGMGRVLVAAVGWVTGRRAGATELLSGGGEAPVCLAARVPLRPRRWSLELSVLPPPPSSIGGWACMCVSGGDLPAKGLVGGGAACACVCVRFRALRGWPEVFAGMAELMLLELADRNLLGSAELENLV